MPKQQTEHSEEQHSHFWRQTTRLDGSKEWICTALYKGNPCNRIRVTPTEYERRIKEYQAYLDVIPMSDSFQDYQAMKVATATKDKEKIKEIKQRIKQRILGVSRDEYDELNIHWKDSAFLPKPDYPDPLTPFLYEVER